MSKIKYIRVSSADQNTARQEINSKSFSKVYVDKCSGVLKLSERPEGKKLIKDIEAGDVHEVHVSSIDRIGRDIIDVLSTIKYLSEKNVNLFVENIGMFSMIKGRPNGAFSLIATVLANVGALEREAILERQKEGIRIAKARGIYKGRLLGTKMTEDDMMKKYKKLVKELQTGQSMRRAAAIAGCSLGTAQRVVSILKRTA